MGFISKLASKTVTKAAPKAALSLSEQAAEETVAAAPPKLSLVKPKTTAKATQAVEPTPAPTAAIEEPEQGIVLSLAEKMAKQEGIAAQTEEALPMPKAESPYNFPNKAFTDEEYAAAEQYLKDNNTAAVFNAMKLNKEEFANTLQTQVAMDKGIKFKDQPPMPYTPKDTPIDEAVGADNFGASLRDVEDNIAPAPRIDVDEKVLSGKLPSFMKTAARDRVLAQIRQHREDSYKKIVRIPETSNYDEQVLAVGQGDYRMRFGKELDIDNAKEREQFFKLLDRKQAEYDKLKQKYKDTPDMTIYHGNTPENIKPIKEKGFIRPSTSGFSGHDELLVNAPSLTRDLNLNFRSSRFGGTNEENFVSSTIPYADYVFMRVNMPEQAYRSQNLDTVAQTISGVPGQARALQLPRADYFETESAMVEADKLALKTDAKTGVKEAVQKFKEYNKKRIDAGNSLNSLTSDIYKNNTLNVTNKDAQAVYYFTKKYLNALAESGKITSVRSGVGQQYQTYISGLSKHRKMFRDVAGFLRQSGSEEKANNLERLADIIEQATNEQPKVTEQALKLTDKFKTGGLVRRK